MIPQGSFAIVNRAYNQPSQINQSTLFHSFQLLFGRVALDYSGKAGKK